MVTARSDSYAAASGGGVFAGISDIPSGAITTISLNTRADVDPRLDSLANPDYPDPAPWESSFGWNSPDQLSAFSGAVLARDIGASGTLMTYCATGHSAELEATCWCGFDVATRLWGIVGRRPLPVPVMTGYTAGTLPASSLFNHTTGAWIGNSADLPLAFRQDGYNPPGGGHTRNSFVYIPASVAGNVGGKIVCCWEPTGNTATTGIAASSIWDADTGLFAPTATLRPNFGSKVTGMQYHAGQDVVIGHNRESNAAVPDIDFMARITTEWTRRNATAGVEVEVDSTSFVIGDLFVMVRHALVAATPPMRLFAVRVSDVVAGASFAWQELTVSAASWPVDAGGVSNSVSWSLCGDNGRLYAVNRISGSHTLWEMTPPAAASDTAALLAGTWSIATQTLGGEGLIGAAVDYSRFQWVPDLHAFTWYGEAASSAVQAVRPIGI